MTDAVNTPDCTAAPKDGVETVGGSGAGVSIATPFGEMCISARTARILDLSPDRRVNSTHEAMNIVSAHSMITIIECHQSLGKTPDEAIDLAIAAAFEVKGEPAS